MTSPIVKYIFVTLLILLSGIQVFSQSAAETKRRVTEIKKWYSEIQQLGLRNCDSRKYVEYDGFSQESPQMEFEQTVNICHPTAIYQIVKGEFSGYEWASDVHIYKRQGKVFFVFVKGISEGFSYERRYYCDSNERIIQELEKTADNGEPITGPNMEIKENINKNIREIQKVEY